MPFSHKIFLSAIVVIICIYILATSLLKTKEQKTDRSQPYEVMRKPSIEEVKSHAKPYFYQSSKQQKSNDFIFMICCVMN